MKVRGRAWRRCSAASAVRVGAGRESAAAPHLLLPLLPPLLQLLLSLAQLLQLLLDGRAVALARHAQCLRDETGNTLTEPLTGESGELEWEISDFYEQSLAQVRTRHRNFLAFYTADSKDIKYINKTAKKQLND